MTAGAGGGGGGVVPPPPPSGNNEGLEPPHMAPILLHLLFNILFVSVAGFEAKVSKSTNR